MKYLIILLSLNLVIGCAEKKDVENLQNDLNTLSKPKGELCAFDTFQFSGGHLTDRGLIQVSSSQLITGEQSCNEYGFEYKTTQKSKHYNYEITYCFAHASSVESRINGSSTTSLRESQNKESWLVFCNSDKLKTDLIYDMNGNYNSDAKYDHPSVTFTNFDKSLVSGVCYAPCDALN